jgi:outer membrane protein assembly factor BamB
MLDAACIDANSGKIIWSVRIHDKFEGKYCNYGMSETPVVVDDKIYYTPGGNKTTMVALDKMTGKTIWTSESLNEEPRYLARYSSTKW